MAVLRRKYFSFTQANITNLPTSQSVTFDSRDIAEGSSPEKIRLIPFGDFLTSGALADIISDLVYNDIQILAETRSLSALTSEGIYESVLNSFNVQPIEYINFSGEDYIKKFIIKDGQLNYKNDNVLIESSKIARFTNATIGTPKASFNENNLDIKLGSLIRSTSIDFGSQVIAKDGVSGITANKNFNETLLINNNDVLFFTTEPVFEVSTTTPGTLNFEDITVVSGININDLYPRYRRDLIEIDAITKEFNVVKGAESSRRPPINTQLDSNYQIKSITRVSGIRHRIYLKQNIRIISNDLSLGKDISITGSTNKKFDGEWSIKNIGSDIAGNYIDIDIPEYRNASNNQIEAGGYVQFNRYGLYSVLLYKPTPDAPTLILDEIQRVSTFSGLLGETIRIVRAELNKDQENFYGVDTRDYAHLIDSQGRLLDWEYGQDTTILPQVAVGYTNVDQYAESQVQFPNYENLNKGTAEGTFTNIPFIISEINDNVFNKTIIELAGFNLGIKNNPESIGNEGLEIKISSADLVFGLPRKITNSIQSKTSLSDAGLNFSQPINSYQVKVNDFIYITAGAGVGQIARVSTISPTTLTLIGLSKFIDNTSFYVIFKNDSIYDITNSLVSISASNINSQIISGVNGKFGEFNRYRKVFIEYDISPEINLGQYYFLRIRGYNEGAVTWDSTPFILTENPNARVVNDQKKLSTFHEVLYKTFQGIYPSGEFLIEDELGDLSEEKIERGLAPHFRPIRYQITARGLDYAGEEVIPPSENIVYVDVHTGRIRFYPGAEPRRLYASYYKSDKLNGKSTGYSLKHREYSQDLQVNIQDKITEIENKFEKGTVFKKPVTFNGIKSSFPVDGFKGPFSIEPDNPFKLTYIDSVNHNNFNIDEENFIIKLTNHYYDDISAVDKDGIYTTNDNISLKDIISGGTINSDLDFLDWSVVASRELQGGFDGISYSESTSGITLNKPGINFYDEFIVTKEKTFDSANPFLRKRFASEPVRQFEYSSDIGFLNTSDAETVDGFWNDIHSVPFNKFQTIRGLLRKSYWEDLDIPLSKDIKRRLKQREVCRILDNQLRPTGSSRSQSAIISEPYLSKQKILSTGKFKNHHLYVAAENINIARYKRIINDAITFDSINADIDNYDAKAFENKLYLAYVDPLSNPINKIKLQIRSLIKNNSTDESYELSEIATPSYNEYISIVDDNAGIKVKIIDVNKDFYAIAYIHNDGIKYRGNIQLRNKTTNEVIGGSDREFTDPTTDTIYTEALFDVKLISENRIAIVWKKTTTSIIMKIYTFSPNGSNTGITEEIVIENVETIDVPKISPVSFDRFIVVYSTTTQSLRLRMYNFFGDILFFDEAKTIPYLQLSNGTQLTGFSFDVAELQNNNIAIAYIDNVGTSSAIFLKGKLKIFYYETFTLSQEISYGSEFSASNRNENYSIISLNENVFAITYLKKDVNRVRHRIFYLNGLETKEASLDSPINRTNLKLIRFSEHAYFNIYKENNSGNYSINLELNEFRINEEEKFAKNSTLELTDSFSIAKSINFESHRDILVYAKESGGYLRVIHKGIEEAYNPSAVYTSILNFSNEKINYLDVVHAKYTGSFSNVNVIIVGYITQSNVAKVKIYNVGTGTFSEATSSTNKIELNNSQRIKLVNLGLGKIMMITSNDGGGKIKINSILLNGIDESNGTWALNANATSLVENVPIELPSEPGDIDVITLQEFNDYRDSIAVFRKSNNALVVRSFAFKINWVDARPLNNLLLQSEDETVFSGPYNSVSVSPVKSNASLICKVAIIDSSGVIHYNEVNFNNLNAPAPEAAQDLGITASTKAYIRYSKDTNYADILYGASGSPGDLKFSVTDGTNVWDTITFDTGKVDTSSTTGITFNESIDGVSFYSSVSGTNKLYAGFINPLSLGSSLDEAPVFDYVSGYATRLYSNVKIGGIDFIGNPLNKTIIFEINTNINEDQIENKELYVSKILESSFNIINFTNDKFSIVMHCHGETQSRNKLYVKHFRISRNRVFAISNWLPSFNFNYESNIENIYLKAINAQNNNCLLVLRDPITKGIKKAIIDDSNAMVNFESIGFDGEAIDSKIIPLTLDYLVEGWSGAIFYDLIYKKYWTVIFNPEGDISWKSASFNIDQFDRTVNLVSDIKMSPYGYFYTFYIDNNGNYKYLQHGWNGDQYGSVQIIGKNFLEAIDTNPDSFVEKSIFRQIEKVKFFNESIANSDLTGGKVSLEHNLRVEYPIVQIYDNDGYQIIPTEIKSIDENTIEIDFSGYTPLSGIWRIRII